MIMKPEDKETLNCERAVYKQNRGLSSRSEIKELSSQIQELQQGTVMSQDRPPTDCVSVSQCSQVSLSRRTTRSWADATNKPRIGKHDMLVQLPPNAMCKQVLKRFEHGQTLLQIQQRKTNVTPMQTHVVLARYESSSLLHLLLRMSMHMSRRLNRLKMFRSCLLPPYSMMILCQGTLSSWYSTSLSITANDLIIH